MMLIFGIAWGFTQAVLIIAAYVVVGAAIGWLFSRDESGAQIGAAIGFFGGLILENAIR